MLTKHNIYMLLPVQIPMFWEAIKYSGVHADEVDPKDYAAYFNELLHALLSDKAQCFVVLDENRILCSLFITRLFQDKAVDKKKLQIQCLYSMSTMTNDEANKYLAFIIKFAKKESCVEVMFNSRNSRVWELAEATNCVMKSRTYAYIIGGE